MSQMHVRYAGLNNVMSIFKYFQSLSYISGLCDCAREEDIVCSIFSKLV